MRTKKHRLEARLVRFAIPAIGGFAFTRSAQVALRTRELAVPPACGRAGVPGSALVVFPKSPGVELTASGPVPFATGRQTILSAGWQGALFLRGRGAPQASCPVFRWAGTLQAAASGRTSRMSPCRSTVPGRLCHAVAACRNDAPARSPTARIRAGHPTRQAAGSQPHHHTFADLPCTLDPGVGPQRQMRTADTAQRLRTRATAKGQRQDKKK